MERYARADCLGNLSEPTEARIAVERPQKVAQSQRQFELGRSENESKWLTASSATALSTAAANTQGTYGRQQLIVRPVDQPDEQCAQPVQLCPSRHGWLPAQTAACIQSATRNASTAQPSTATRSPWRNAQQPGSGSVEQVRKRKINFLACHTVSLTFSF